MAVTQEAIDKAMSEHSHSLRLSMEYAEIGNKWASDFWKRRAESYLRDAMRMIDARAALTETKP